MSDWEGKSDEQQTFNMEDETINQNFADFFHIEVLEGSMLDDKDEKGAVVIMRRCQSFRVECTDRKRDKRRI